MIFKRPICWLRGHEDVLWKWISQPGQFTEWLICRRCGRRKLERFPKRDEEAAQ